MSAVPLDQQELYEAPPRRKLIVPAGHSAWWGIDPSTKRIALAAVLRRPDGEVDRMVKTASFMPGEGAQRLSGIRSETFRFVQGIAACCTWPGVVVVEQPGGSQRNWPLYFAVGVILEAVHAALLDVTGRAVRIEMISPASWKLRACGRGNIYKPDPKKGRGGEYGVLTWARANGYEGYSFDEADALGIAEAARREIALVSR